MSARWTITLLALWIGCTVPSFTFAAEQISLCHSGMVQLRNFADHVKVLRGLTRYSSENVAELIAQQKKGGSEFFSSQVIVQEEQSGSGTYDLRTWHGLNDARHYRNVTPWTCEAAHYPIVYFVGFRVRKISGTTIFVSRDEGTVNVISLKAIDKDLEKHVKVKIFESDNVLCSDLAKGCSDGIFYERG
jgi:hypothetical protein